VIEAAPDAPLPPSGDQYTLRYGTQRAVVTEVGATLREYETNGVAVVDGFAVDERASGGRGQVLAPWPNRLGDGRYTFRGETFQAALNEPERANAIHGLVRWRPWACVAEGDDAVELACVVTPEPGYPCRLALGVEYRLGGDGLTVTATAVNRSATTAPFGIGFHPYLTVGTPTVDSASLTMPARRRLVMDERGLPVGDATVAGTDHDFVAGRPIGALVLDTAFTDLIRDDDGRARVHLGAEGDAVTIWVDASFRCLMAFTGDTLPAARRRQGIAIEPMTCPPDALRTGTDLIELAPGGSWRGQWGITPRTTRTDAGT
jgi:aldose 1-epimerase